MNKIKIIITILTIVLCINNIYSQTIPQTFSYQAVARNYEGLPVANQDIVVEITILQGTDCNNGSSCNNLWQELHYPVTNEFGLFSIEIGNGQTTYAGSESDYNNIDWNDVFVGNYFLKVRVDFGEAIFGNGLIDMGITEFLSVPYSLSSEISLDIARTGGKVPISLSELNDVNITTPSDTQVLKWDGTQWINGAGTTGGATSIAELSDVVISGTPVANQVIVHNGTNWINQGISLNNLAMVNTGTLLANDVLLFDGMSWINSKPILNLDNLTNVNISAVANNQVLTYNSASSKWINVTPSTSSGYWTQTGSDIYYNTGKVGIGTATPSAKFDLVTTTTDYFSVSGEYNTATIINTPPASGSKLFFYPINASLRAGYTTGTQWNDAYLGNYSAAFGYNNISSGSGSFSTGSTNIAGGVSAAAFGESNSAAGARTLVSGTLNSAAGDNSVAFGESNQTIGATNSQSSFVCGNGNQTSGQFTSAWGVGTRAREYAMMAIGHYNATLGSGSQTSWLANALQPVFVVGNGTSTIARADAFVIYQTGNATLAGTLTSASDRTLKDNILQIENPIENINKLRGVTYSWKEEVAMSKSENNFHYGFIAQEVEEVFPSMVFTNSSNIKSIAYQEFIPILLEAVKEQQKQIEELKVQNEILKAENQNISTKVDDLIKKVDELRN